MAIVAKFARKVDSVYGSTRKALSQRIEHYMKLAKKLESRGCLVAPVAGGLSKADVRDDELDRDLVQPNASVGIHDHPGQVTNIKGDLLP
jgi:hypothetical protein